MSEKIEDPFRVQIRHNDLCRISATAQEHEVIGTYVPITSCYLQNNPRLLDYLCLNVMEIFYIKKVILIYAAHMQPQRNTKSGEHMFL